jgi:hypothetical protein
MFHLVAVAATSAPTTGGELLTNGGFEDGLRGWNQACTSPSCGAVTNVATHRSGNSGLSLSCTADSWTSLALRQPLPDPLPSGQLSLQAWVKAARGEMPAVRLGVTLEFEDASGSQLEGCIRTRDEMPSSSEWSLLATQCAVPASAARGWVALEWACVRSEATLLIDDTSLRHAAEQGAAELAGASDVPATLPGEQVPRRLHLIFGLAADFGGKPFGLTPTPTLTPHLHLHPNPRPNPNPTLTLPVSPTRQAVRAHPPPGHQGGRACAAPPRWPRSLPPQPPPQPPP